MTVTTSSSTTGPMAGDGSNASWPFSFPVQASSQLEVIHTADAVETVVASNLYSVALTNEGRSGGTVTYPLTSDRVAADETVTIRRSMTFTQPTNLRNQGTLAPETVEAIADRCVMQIQQVKEIADRGLRQPSSDADAIGELPPAASRASGYLAFDGDGDPIAASAVDLVGTTVSSYAATLLDDASASAALSTLGVSTYAKTLLDDASASAALTTLGVSSFAATVLDDASASAARTTLGAGAPQTASLGASGWWRCADTGLILQWGSTTGGTTVTFPIAFPTACRAVFLTASNDTLARIGTAGTTTTTQSTIRLWDLAGAASTNTVRWLALGD